MKLDQNIVAIVTGGASGLGLAVVQNLRAQAVKVVIADYNPELGKETAALYSCQFFETNVADEENVKQLIEFTKKKYQSIHIVVNCAGIATLGTIIYSKGVVSSQVMENVLRVNVIGTLNVSKYAAKAMSEQPEIQGERGVIVNVSSIAGSEGQRGQVVYSASKGAVNAMTLPMARDLGRLRIRVMTIAPGLMVTPMSDGMTPAVRKHFQQSTPIGRLGTPEDFAVAVESVVRCGFMTGSVIRLDGGIRAGYL